MRQIFAFLEITADGFFETDKGEIDWFGVDDDFRDFARAQLDAADTLLFGRRTYETMVAYWPTAAAKEKDPDIAERMNGYSKIVVSRTLTAADWPQTRVLADPRDVASIKSQPGKDIAILGSAELTAAMLEIGLIDELRLMVNPVLLGSGHAAMAALTRRTELRLKHTMAFTGSGNVLLSYAPIR